MEMRNKVYSVGQNATFYCIMRVNTSDGLLHINQTDNIEWTFTPVGSSASQPIMTPGVSDSPGPTPDPMPTPDDASENTGESGFHDSPKYVRQFWRDLTIRNVRASDAGTYTCRHTQYNMATSAQLYVIGMALLKYSILCFN